MQRIYQNVLRQSQAFGICALIALALSCIGLFAPHCRDSRTAYEGNRHPQSSRREHRRCAPVAAVAVQPTRDMGKPPCLGRRGIRHAPLARRLRLPRRSATVAIPRFRRTRSDHCSCDRDHPVHSGCSCQTRGSTSLRIGRPAVFRNCLAAALRHLARNKLYTAISVLGLSVGLCTALLAALVIRNELGHDHFISGYDPHLHGGHRHHAPWGSDHLQGTAPTASSANNWP